MGCVWEVEGWADMRVGTSPSSLRSSLSHHAAPPRWRLTGACQEPVNGRMDRRATQYNAALADCRHSTAHEDDAAAGLIPT